MSTNQDIRVKFTYVLDSNNEFVCQAKFVTMCGYGDNVDALMAQKKACYNLFTKMKMFRPNNPARLAAIDEVDKLIYLKYQVAKETNSFK